MDLPKIFEQYLEQQKVSKNTRKNYLADFKHFLSWLKQKTGVNPQAGYQVFNLLSSGIILEYKNHLLETQAPLSTINRCLSTLRKFSSFAFSQGWLEENPTRSLTNLKIESNQPPTEKVLENFQSYLQKEKVSPITVKNYLSDIRHFLAWLESN